MRPLQKKKKNPNNSCIRNLSQAICMPSIYCNFFLGFLRGRELCSYQKQQTWPRDAFASKWPPWTKSRGLRPRRDFPAMLRQPCVSLTQPSRGSWAIIYRHSIRCSMVLFRRRPWPEPVRTYQNGTAPRCTVHHPPLSTVSPVYSSEMQFQNFFNNSFCSSHRFWTHTPQTPNQPLPPIRALVACQKLHFRLRLWLRLGALWLRICLLQLGLHKCIASSGWWSPGLWTNTKTRTEPLGWTLTKCLIDSSLNFC